MQIGITGANGLIGRRVGQLAQQAGHRVVAYTRDAQRPCPSWAAELRQLDPAASQPLNASGLDALVHLAGETVLGVWTQRKKQRIWDSRVPLTQKIVQCLAQAQTPVFISGSAVGYYGDAGSAWLPEQAPAGRDFLARLCVDWEAAAMQAQHEHGIRTVTVRTGLVLSSEGGAFPLMRRAFRWAAGGRLGSGQHYMPWIHGEDEARLMLWAAEQSHVTGAMNACAPTPVTNAEFTQALASAVHRPAFFHTPAFVLRTLLGELGGMLLSSQRASSEKAVSLGFRFQYAELASALEQLCRG
jgi:uncharacterized protein